MNKKSPKEKNIEEAEQTNGKHKSKNAKKRILIVATFVSGFLIFSTLLVYFVINPYIQTKRFQNTAMEYHDLIDKALNDIYITNLSEELPEQRIQTFPENTSALEMVAKKLDSIVKLSRGNTNTAATELKKFDNDVTINFIYPENEYYAKLLKIEKEFQKLNINYPPELAIFSSNSEVAQKAIDDYTAFKETVMQTELVEQINITKRDKIIETADFLIQNLEKRKENRIKLGELLDPLPAKYPYLDDKYGTPYNTTARERQLHSQQIVAWNNERKEISIDVRKEYKQLVEEGESIIAEYNSDNLNVYDTYIHYLEEYNKTIAVINKNVEINLPQLMQKKTNKYAQISKVQVGNAEKEMGATLILEGESAKLNFNILQNNQDERITNVSTGVGELEGLVSEGANVLEGTYKLAQEISIGEDKPQITQNKEYISKGTLFFEKGYVNVSIEVYDNDKVVYPFEFTLWPVFEEDN